MHKLKHMYLPAPLVAGEVPLPKDVAHRLRKVLRLPDGAMLAITNGQDGLWQAELVGNALHLRTLLAPQPAPRPRHLYLALSKKDAMERALRQSTELGVTDIHPLLTAHCVADSLNTARAQAILVEALEQCERLSLPTLHPVQRLAVAIPTAPPLLWCYERSPTAPAPTAPAPSIGILVGPEGGFSSTEVDFLRTQPHIQEISLGETILRVDTAVVVGLCLLEHHL